MRNGELERRLRAQREPAPKPALRTRLEQGIPDAFRQRESRWRQERTWAMAKVGAVAATLTVVVAVLGWFVLGFILGPGGSGVAFAAMLEPVAQATGKVEGVHVVIRVLTRPGEDFAFANLGGDLQKVEAWIRGPSGPEDPGRSRLEKLDRIYCFDGKELISYHPAKKEAFRAKASQGAADLLLFWPATWVRQILSTPSKDVEVLSHEEKSGKGRLLLHERAAKLDPRQEPSFWSDFDRETEIEWDLSTLRLTGLEQWVFDRGERRLFSELVSIEYLPAIDESVFHLDLPPDVRWGGERHASSEIAALGPRDLARVFFEAAMEGDRATLEMVCPSPATVDAMLGGDRRPSRIYYIGEPFRSGSYPGVYVPYRVRFGSGPKSVVKEYQMAVRNDNPEHRWVFDGGI